MTNFVFYNTPRNINNDTSFTMPLTFDEYPHPQLRYTIRLEWENPNTKEIECTYFYMTDEEFGSQRHYDIIEENKEQIQEEFYDLEITKWGEDYCENLFFKNDILSDAICNYLKYGRRLEIAPLTAQDSELEELQKNIAFQYLNEIRADYSIEDVARAILKITRNPKYEYAKRILAVWGVVLQENYIEYQLRNIINRNNINDQLGKLLKENTDENLRRIKIKLRYLNEDWNLQHEKDAHKMAILVYRFICDCHLISRHNASRATMMEIIYSYLNLPKSTYNRDTQLTEPTPKEYEAFNNGENLSALAKRKCKIYLSISSKWAAFKKSRLQ